MRGHHRSALFGARALALVALVAPVTTVGCTVDASDPLAEFGGGFDPLRYDAGTLAPAALGRPSSCRHSS